MADVPALEGPKKKSSPILLIAALAGLTVLGGGGGFVVGKLIAPKVKQSEEEQQAAEAKAEEADAKKGKADDKKLPKMPGVEAGIVQLDPITTNLAYPSESWIRLEVALVFKGPVDNGLAQDVYQDILAYMRTVSLQQIQGPRGFEYLKEDLQERVDVRSQGRVSKVLFRTFVIE